MKFRNIILLLICSAVIVSCARNKGPERFYFGNYSEAEKHFNKGEYKDAIVKYQAYLDENPEGNLAVISQYYIGKSHAALGNNDEAKAIYRQVINAHPDLVWAKFAQTQLQELEKK